MKKVFLFCAIGLSLFAFTACNNYCVCTVTKDGQTFEKYDYSDEELNQEECWNKVNEQWTRLNDTYTSESLVGVAVTCDHL